MPAAESQWNTIAMKKGCWLRSAPGCPGDNAEESPICKPCWDTATPSKLEAVKFEYNLYTDQPYCRLNGCWSIVKRKNKARGICTHQILEGKCYRLYYTLPSE